MGMGFKTIYADPPWPESGGGKIKRGADRHYPLMACEEIICEMRVGQVVDSNAHLWLWVTNNYLAEGLRAMNAWGFRYITNFVWVKTTKDGKVRGGLGQYSRGAHEILLFGVRGTLPAADGATYEDKLTAVLAERGAHSAKPEVFYTKIEAISPGPRLELFSRTARAGWYTMGNHELPGLKHIQTDDIAEGLHSLAHNLAFLREVNKAES